MFFDVILGSDAGIDLDDIYDYIADNDSVESAEYVNENIENVIRSLSSFPNRGVVPHEMRSKGISAYRQIFFKPYRIIYRVDEENREVRVLVIADGRRDIVELLGYRLII